MWVQLSPSFPSIPSNLLHIRRIGWNGLDMISALGMFSGCIQGVQRLDSLVTECGFLFVRSCTIYKGARTNAQEQSADFGLCCISYDCYNSCWFNELCCSGCAFRNFDYICRKLRNATNPQLRGSMFRIKWCFVYNSHDSLNLLVVFCDSVIVPYIW